MGLTSKTLTDVYVQIIEEMKKIFVIKKKFPEMS